MDAAVDAAVCPTCCTVVHDNGAFLSVRETRYHPACWNCVVCGLNMGTAEYVMRDDGPMCHVHLATLCSVCGLPLSDECLRVADMSLHDDCYMCHECDTSLLERDDVQIIDGMFACGQCAIRGSGTPKGDGADMHSCVSCLKQILPGEESLNALDRFWHKDHFRCFVCECVLEDHGFHYADGLLYCMQHYSRHFMKKCNGCNELIDGREGRAGVEACDRFWHAKCFRCSGCAAPLAGTVYRAVAKGVPICYGCPDPVDVTKSPSRSSLPAPDSEQQLTLAPFVSSLVREAVVLKAMMAEQDAHVPAVLVPAVLKVVAAKEQLMSAMDSPDVRATVEAAAQPLAQFADPDASAPWPAMEDAVDALLSAVSVAVAQHEITANCTPMQAFADFPAVLGSDSDDDKDEEEGDDSKAKVEKPQMQQQSSQKLLSIRDTIRESVYFQGAAQAQTSAITTLRLYLSFRVSALSAPCVPGQNGVFIVVHSHQRMVGGDGATIATIDFGFVERGRTEIAPIIQLESAETEKQQRKKSRKSVVVKADPRTGSVFRPGAAIQTCFTVMVGVDIPCPAGTVKGTTSNLPDTPLRFSVHRAQSYERNETDVAEMETCIGTTSCTTDELLAKFSKAPEGAKDSLPLWRPLRSFAEDKSAIGSLGVCVNVEWLKSSTECAQQYIFAATQRLAGPSGDALPPEIIQRSGANVPRLIVREELKESAFAFEVPKQLLAIFEQRHQRSYTKLAEILKNQEKMQTDKGHLKWLSEALVRIREHLLAIRRVSKVCATGEYEGFNFKPSTYKADRLLAYIATNLHTHSVQRRFNTAFGEAPPRDPALCKKERLCTVTVGAFCAYVYKFKRGGLRQLIAEKENLEQSQKGTDKTWQGYQRYHEIEDLKWQMDVRWDMAVSQAASALVTSFVFLVDEAVLGPAPEGRALLDQLSSVGFLFTVESLLSCQGSELGMLCDMDVAVKALSLFTFRLNEVPDIPGRDEGPGISRQNCPVVIKANGKDGRVDGYTIDLWVKYRPGGAVLPAALATGRKVNVTPLLFTIGINEKQLLANMTAALPKKLGYKTSVAVQVEINNEGLVVLEQYYQAYKAYRMDPLTPRSRSWISLADLNDHWHTIKATADPKKGSAKAVQLACDFARFLGAARVTCCKSAKDRTSMAVTYEFSRVLHKPFGADGDAVLKAASTMRRYGVRRQNVYKNTGQWSYAFNPIQQLCLPKEYQPPNPTLTTFKTHVVASLQGDGPHYKAQKSSKASHDCSPPG